MLNQFIQIRIQIRNAGSAATGCLIDGLIDVVHGFLGHMARLMLTPFGQPQSDSGLGARSLQLGKRDWLLQPRYGYWPRAGELWLQG
ncbi:MAG: hypothetical protein AAF827_09335 [Cyanobacteria bacterium P01_D01_bin.6]